jgi:hypothetical protein
MIQLALKMTTFRSFFLFLIFKLCFYYFSFYFLPCTIFLFLSFVLFLFFVSNFSSMPPYCTWRWHHVSSLFYLRERLGNSTFCSLSPPSGSSNRFGCHHVFWKLMTAHSVLYITAYLSVLGILRGWCGFLLWWSNVCFLSQVCLAEQSARKESSFLLAC